MDWPEEEEAEDWSALEADGWISMDAILVRVYVLCVTRIERGVVQAALG